MCCKASFASVQRLNMTYIDVGMQFAAIRK